MNNTDKNLEKSIVLEDLLKIKRHERPSDIFWEKFDEQLHQRTLEELVYKPSLFSRFLRFSRLSRFLSISLRPALSVGAFALLTLAMQPSFFSRTASVLVKNTVSMHEDNPLVDLASVKRNYIKNEITAEIDENCHYAGMRISSSPSLDGVRYIAGTLASAGLSSSVSNVIY